MHAASTTSQPGTRQAHPEGGEELLHDETNRRVMARRVLPADRLQRVPFGQVLRDQLIERGYTTGIGNPDWSRFALELDGIRYESLRKAVTREREPSVKIMESCAGALGVDPTIFWEYQLAQVRRGFDLREVGEDEAFANLQRWLKAR
jgi:hypothetical protein